MSNSSFDSIIKQQDELYRLIKGAIKNLDEIKKISQIDDRIKELETKWDNFKSKHDELIGMKTEKTKKHPYFTELYKKCEEKYFYTKNKMQDVRIKIEGVSTHADTNISQPLPKEISLPKFSGNSHEWSSFRDQFESKVNGNSDITFADKLNYLRNNVTGKAKQFLSILPTEFKFFDDTWKTFALRYDEKHFYISECFDELFNVLDKSSENLMKLTAVKEFLSNLKALGVPVDSLDLFITYFTYYLGSKFHEDWGQRQNKSTETFNQFEKFLEERIKNLETAHTSQQSHASEHLFSKTLKCECCDSNAHLIASCYNFYMMSIHQRYNVLKKKRLCFSCFKRHKSECLSKNPCQICSKEHHTLLHNPKWHDGESSDSIQNAEISLQPKGHPSHKRTSSSLNSEPARKRDKDIP